VRHSPMPRLLEYQTKSMADFNRHLIAYPSDSFISTATLMRSVAAAKVSPVPPADRNGAIWANSRWTATLETRPFRNCRKAILSDTSKPSRTHGARVPKERGGSVSSSPSALRARNTCAGRPKTYVSSGTNRKTNSRAVSHFPSPDYSSRCGIADPTADLSL
jgi:hypothetical protein